MYISLFLAVLGLCCCSSSSLVAAGGGSSPAVVPGLLTAVAALVGRRLEGTHASVAAVSSLQSTASIVVVRRLSCSTTHGTFLDQGLNPCLLHWEADSLPLSHQ